MKRLSTKATIDGRVSDALGEKPANVKRITRQFLLELLKELVDIVEVPDGVGVRLDGLGVLWIRSQQGAQCRLVAGTFRKNRRGTAFVVDACQKYYVSFRKSAAFNEALRTKKEAVHGKVLGRRKRPRSRSPRKESRGGLPQVRG